MSIHAGSTPQNRTPPTIEKRKVSVSLCKFRLTEFSGVWAYTPCLDPCALAPTRQCAGRIRISAPVGTAVRPRPGWRPGPASPRARAYGLSSGVARRSVRPCAFRQRCKTHATLRKPPQPRERSRSWRILWCAITALFATDCARPRRCRCWPHAAVRYVAARPSRSERTKVVVAVGAAVVVASRRFRLV